MSYSNFRSNKVLQSEVGDDAQGRREGDNGGGGGRGREIGEGTKPCQAF